MNSVSEFSFLYYDECVKRTIRRNVYAVSYTHLDVYKRQAVSSDSDILKKSLLAYRIHSESENMDWHLLVQLQDV